LLIRGASFARVVTFESGDQVGLYRVYRVLPLGVSITGDDEEKGLDVLHNGILDRPDLDLDLRLGRDGDRDPSPDLNGSVSGVDEPTLRVGDVLEIDQRGCQSLLWYHSRGVGYDEGRTYRHRIDSCEGKRVDCWYTNISIALFQKARGYGRLAVGQGRPDTDVLDDLLLEAVGSLYFCERSSGLGADLIHDLIQFETKLTVWKGGRADKSESRLHFILWQRGADGF
jgi:hypothetical protein